VTQRGTRQRRRWRRTPVPLTAVALLSAGCQGALPPSPEAPATLIWPATPRGSVAVPADAAGWDRITAPIALYCDPLLAQVLVASTHPEQISQAARWLAGIPSAQLGDEVPGARLQREHWDASVKSLIAVADVLNMMSAHPRWLRQLGAAFQRDPAAMMDSVQRLRRWALDYDSLHSTREQLVADDAVTVSIQPSRPDTIYVSYYQPQFVYGRWPWPHTPPYSFQPPDQVVFGGAPIAFGIPVNLTALPWRWYQWHWRQHRLEALPSGR
jgi:hypothetical protein